MYSFNYTILFHELVPNFVIKNNNHQNFVTRTTTTRTRTSFKLPNHYFCGNNLTIDITIV